MNEALQGLPLFDRVDVCAKRHGGSPESQAAYREHHGAFSKQRSVILGLVRRAGANGLTCKEAAGELDVGMNQISGRFSELKFNHDIFVVRDAANKVVRRDGCAAYRAASEM